VAEKAKEFHKVHVKKGDTVVVITGKNKGKKGKVLSVIRDKGRVVVEGVNIVKKHTRPNPQVMQGGIIEKEAPIASSNVMIFCDKCNAPRRIRHNSEGHRVCHKCGAAFDK
jgi:large subunit ribosomal protein L24